MFEVELQRVQELDGVVRLLVDVGDPLHPRDLAGRVALFLVAPVRRDPVLGPAVHLLGADLDLDRLAVEADDRRVQRLVEVELRRIDVVLEAALHRRPQGVHRSERRPAVLLRGHDHPDRDEIVDLVELLAPHDHLLVDAPEVLRAPGDLGLDPRLGEAGANDGEYVGELDFAPRGACGDHLSDLTESLRVERLEREILQLPLHFLDPEPVRQRRVDVPSLLCGPALLPLGHHRQRPHVVEPVGQFDDEHPPVAGHRDEHLAHRRGLLRLFRIETEPVQLRNPVHNRRHRRAELRLDLGETRSGVLDGVVQQRRGRAHRVQAEIGDDGRDRYRMGDVRLAREPVLALVSLRRESMGTPNEVEILADAPDRESGEDPFHIGGRWRDEGAGRVFRRRLDQLCRRTTRQRIDHRHGPNLPAPGRRAGEPAASWTAVQVRCQRRLVTNQSPRLAQWRTAP